ncbi:MAG: hypothetical protein AAF388_03540 [Bacteroidota bacterium]
MINEKLFRSLLALTILSFIAGLGYWITNNQKESQEAKVFQQDIEPLNNELLELERIVLELEALYDVDPDMNRPKVLKEGAKKVNHIEEQIDGFEAKWGKTSKQLLLVKEDLSENKLNLIDQYENELESHIEEKNRLKEIIDVFLSSPDIVVTKDYREISLPKGNLKVDKFRYYNISVDKEESRTRFEAGNIEELKVEIDILENMLADRRIYELYLIIKAPDGTILKNITEGYGGVLKKADKPIAYSSKISIFYEGRANYFYFHFRPSKYQPFKRGVYSVSVYCETCPKEEIGTGTFTVD